MSEIDWDDPGLFILVSDQPWPHEVLVNARTGMLFRNRPDRSEFITKLPASMAMEIDQEHTNIPGSSHQHIMTAPCWCRPEALPPDQENPEP